MEEIVIPREEATFYLDKHGRWRNAHGRFRHKRIIDHFNASIRKDEGGYFLTQINGERTEKVYFRYEDTALFAVDVAVEASEIRLTLNTGRTVSLRPDTLVIEGDYLYMKTGDDRIKFAERTMMKIAAWVVEVDGEYWFDFGGGRYKIALA